MLLATVILMDILSGAEFDLFVSTFPEIQSKFNLSPAWVEALLSVNFLGYFLGVFFAGGLADRYGRKPIIVLGLLTFIMGSLLCLYPTSYTFLLMGRLLQGIGVSAPAILSFLIIADIYPLKKQQSLMGILNGLMNVSVAAAPVVGSYITLYFHWQGNFIALLLLGVGTLVMTILFIPTHKVPNHGSPLTFREYLPILQSGPLLLLIIHIIFMTVPCWIFVGMSPLLYMGELGVDLAHFGLYQGSLALIFALGSLLSGFMVSRFDQRNMLNISNLVFMIGLGSISLAAFSNTANPLLITLAFVPFVIGQIMPTTILYTQCLNFIPGVKGGIAAILAGGRLILSAIGLQLAGYYYQGSFRNIGLTIMIFVVIAILSLHFVIRNPELMKGIPKGS